MATKEMLVTVHGEKVPVSNVSRYELTGGPALLDLLFGYAYAYPDRKVGRPIQWVNFVVSDEKVLKARIVRLEHEDGNGGAHNLDVYVRGCAGDGATFVPYHKASGCYNTARRTGYLNVLGGGPDLGEPLL